MESASVRGFPAEDARPDNSEPELLQGADSEGAVDPFGLEEPLRQTLPVCPQPPGQHAAAPAAPRGPVSCPSPFYVG